MCYWPEQLPEIIFTESTFSVSPFMLELLALVPEVPAVPVVADVLLPVLLPVVLLLG